MIIASTDDISHDRGRAMLVTQGEMYVRPSRADPVFRIMMVHGL